MKQVLFIGFMLQFFKHFFKRPVFYPFDELPIAGDVGNIVIMGQIPPAAAGGQHIEQAVNHLVKIGRGAAGLTITPPDQRLN